jgi:hypothetical protein
MRPIAISGITLLVALLCSTARADDVEVCEDDIYFYDDGGLREQLEEYDDDIPEWGWSNLEWITIVDPGSCHAEQCSGRCDIYVWGCDEANNCSGWVDWTQCWNVQCDEIDNCA